MNYGSHRKEKEKIAWEEEAWLGRDFCYWCFWIKTWSYLKVEEKRMKREMKHWRLKKMGYNTGKDGKEWDQEHK